MTCSTEQIRLLFKYAQTDTQEMAAAKAGMSLSTAKRYLAAKGEVRSVERKQPTGRTRVDPFAEVWPEVRSLLERDPGLEAKTLMEYLMDSYPDRFKAGQVRTLRRRVHDWRALEGPERREVMFLQTIQPGAQSQSDYTWCNSLEITIAGEFFPHLLFHFMLPYSRWEFVWVCHTESFETLTTGFSSAVAVLGAVAPEHRTDNLAAAVPIGEAGTFQRRWENFLAHFDVVPSANNPGRSNENGSVEKSHDLFKHSLDQRLRLRGSRDFRSLQAYEEYLDSMTRDRNRHRRDRLQEELPHLKSLPREAWNEPREYAASVTAWSTVRVGGATYSVPSRFIGQKLKALAYFETVEIYFGKHLVQSVPRKPAGGIFINYRHLIFHLLRKPGAFRNYQFRDELFPRKIFRHAYDKLIEANEDKADKEYLHILHQSALNCETAVAECLEMLIETNQLPTSERVKQFCGKKPRPVPDVSVAQPSLESYDNLLHFIKPKERNPNNESTDTTI